MLPESSLTRFFKGRTVFDEAKRVARVLKHKSTRVFVFSDKSVKVVGLAQAREELHRQLAQEQKASMQKTMRKTSLGYSVKIGGRVKGTRRYYKTKKGAKIALSRAYGK